MRVPRRFLVALLPLVPGAAAQEAAVPAEAWRSGYDDGFFLRSADGTAELVLEGLFQTTIGLFDPDREPSSDFAIKRMRPELAGRFGGLRFRLEPKFTEDEVELEEAWVGTDLWGGDGRLLFGRMKAPFSLEEVRSRRHIDFPSFSLLNQFAPAEDHGVFLDTRPDAGLLELGLAAYNGTGGSDTNSSKDLAARVMVHPFHERERSAWRDLQLGLAATVGRQDEGDGGGAIENEAGREVVRFSPDAALDGQRTRLGLEAAWFHGPWFVQAEGMRVSQRMSAGAEEVDAAFDGAYLTVARVLTGEDRSFAGVRPALPFDFADGSGRGAWVLAARASTLSIDRDLAGVFVPREEFTAGIDSLSVGLNWVPNEHAIVRHTLIWSRYDDEVRLDRGSDDEELAFLIELQLHF